MRAVLAVTKRRISCPEGDKRHFVMWSTAEWPRRGDIRWTIRRDLYVSAERRGTAATATRGGPFFAARHRVRRTVLCGSFPLQAERRGVARKRRSLCRRNTNDGVPVRILRRPMSAALGLPVSTITSLSQMCRQSISSALRRDSVVPISFGVMARLPVPSPSIRETKKFRQRDRQTRWPVSDQSKVGVVLLLHSVGGRSVLPLKHFLTGQRVFCQLQPCLGNFENGQPRTHRHSCR